MAQATAKRLAAFAETSAICDGLLQRSLEFTGATFGNVQLVDWRLGELRIVSQLGFQPDFLSFFARVKYQDSCACARALGDRAAVVVGDVMSDAAFAPYRDVAEQAGFRAVQSTPLLSSRSAIVGIVSTHFSAAHEPTLAELAGLREIGRFAADAIIAYRAGSHVVPGLSSTTRQAMEKAEDYLQHAAECRERALYSKDTLIALEFLELAEQWRELAERVDYGETS